MTTPLKMFRSNVIIVDMRRNWPKKSLLVFMVFCMFVGNIAVGYNAADLVRMIKQWGEEEKGEVVNIGVTIITSLFVLLTAVHGIRLMCYNRLKALNAYAGFVFLSLCLQIFCTLDKAIDLAEPACHMTRSFCKNVTELGLVEQRRIWDGIQTTQKCCGLNNPDDYLSMNTTIPVSCCPEAYARSNELARNLMYNDCIETATYYKNGCIVKVLEMEDFEMKILIVGAVILIGIQFCGMLLALWVASRPFKMKVYKISAAL